jgi:hypothetical protein
MDDNGNTPTPADALRALTARGVNGAHDLLELGTPEEILAACHRWDSEKNVRPGLLVRWIRDGKFEGEEEAPAPSKGQQLRARFEEYAARFPEGTAVETHAQLIERRWPDEFALGGACIGDMVVIEATYPLLSMECDACGFVAALPVKALHILGAPLRLAEPTTPF